MARNITVNTEVTGEASFRQAMTQISDSLRVVKSEMNAAAAEFAGHSNTMEALTARHTSLSEKLDLEKSKVEALRQAMERASTETGENSSETMRLTAQYNNARAAMATTEQELARVSGYMSEAAANADGCATSIDAYGNGVKNAKDNQSALAEDAPTSFNAVADAIISAGIASKLGDIAKKITEITRGAASYADGILTMSTQTGIATDELQVLTYAAGLVDVSVSDVTGAMQRTVRAMSSAKSGSGDAAAAFNTLGVSATDADGNLRNSQTVFWECVDALAAIENPTERDALAMAVFGRNAQTLNPLIKAGSEGMAAMRTEAEQLGFVLSDNDLKTLGNLDDSAQRFANATEAVKNSVGVAWAPTLTELTDTGTALLTMFNNFVQEHPSVVASFTSVATAVAGVASAYAALRTVVKGAETLKLISPQAAATMAAALGPLGVAVGAVAAIMGIGITTAANYFDSLKNVGMIDENASLEELAANVEKCNKELEDFKKAWGEEPNAEWTDATFYQQRELTAAAANAQAQYEAALAAAEAAGTGEAAAAATAEEAINAVTDAVDNLIAAYNNSYNSAYSAIKGTTGLFNDLSGTLGKSSGEVVKTWESQTDAVTAYTENLDNLRNAGLSEDLVLEISSGSLEDMQLAAQLMQDIDGGNISVSDINDQWTARQEAMAEYAAYVAEHSNEVQDAMQSVVEAAQLGAGDMDLSSEMQTSAINTIAGYVGALDAGPIRDKMAAIAREALAAFNNALGIASPSRRMMESAHWTVAGFTQGIESEERDVAAVMSGMADTAVDAFDASLTGFESAAPAAAAAGTQVTTNIYVQEMTEAQTDYLVGEVNRRLGA